METTAAPTEIDACCADCASTNTTTSFIAGAIVTVVGVVVVGKVFDKVKAWKANRKTTEIIEE